MHSCFFKVACFFFAVSCFALHFVFLEYDSQVNTSFRLAFNLCFVWPPTVCTLPSTCTACVDLRTGHTMQHCMQYCAQCGRSRSKFYFCNISRNNCTVCPPHRTQLHAMLHRTRVSGALRWYFGRVQIRTQVDASFSHDSATQPKSTQVDHKSIVYRHEIYGFLRPAWIWESTCESVWPHFASP